MNEEITEVSPEELAERKAAVKETGRCPYCDSDLHTVDLTSNPFNSWDTDEIWLCVNRQCGYRVLSERVMAAQNIPGGSYRFLYIPARDWCGPVADSIASQLAARQKG
jgi:hypothetical protein